MTTHKIDATKMAWLNALCNPMRQRIIRVLIEDQRPLGISPVEISRILRLPLPNVSYQVRKLAESDVIVLVHEEPVRGALRHFYVISSEFMKTPWVIAVLEAFIPGFPKAVTTADCVTSVTCSSPPL